ncbi:MAG: TrkA C-terminal domain-containing protein [Halobacteriaceae archaeon]
MGYHIDDIDRRILFHLATDARNTSGADIADKVDVTSTTIRHRIQQLEEQGVIQGYHAAIDYERSEELMQLEFTCTAPPADRQRLATETTEISGVVAVRELTTGQGNLRIIAVCTDSNDITRLTRELSSLGLTIDQQAIVHSERIQPYQPFAPEESEQTASLTDFRSLSGGAEVIEFTVSENAPIAGQTLAEANDTDRLPDDVLVISLERGETIQAPKGDTTIQAGDVVTLFARDSLPDETLAAFNVGKTSTSPNR